MLEPITRSQEQSDNIGELAAALAKAQGEIEGATKDSENPFFKSKYADLYSVWQACRKPLSKNGIAIIQTTDNLNGSVIVITTMVHSSGEWIRGKLEVKPIKPDPQSLGSAITYGRRYALAAIVGVCPEDDDAEAAMNRGEKGRKKEQHEKSQGPIQKTLVDYKKEVQSVKTVKELESWWYENSTSVPELLSDNDFKELVGVCAKKKEALMKPTSEIVKYYAATKESKEILGEEQYREILNELGLQNAASAKTKKERDMVLSALKASLEVKEKEPSGEMIPCPNTGMPDDPESWDEMTPEYCSRCDKKDGCPAFE